MKQRSILTLVASTLLSAFVFAEAPAPLQIPTTIPPYREWRMYRPFQVDGATKVEQTLNEGVLSQPPLEVADALAASHADSHLEWNRLGTYQLRTPAPRAKILQVWQAYQDFQKTLSGGELAYVQSKAQLKMLKSTATGDTWTVLSVPVARASVLDLSPVVVARYVFAELQVAGRQSYELELKAAQLKDLKDGSDSKAALLKQLNDSIQSNIVFTYGDEELQKNLLKADVPLAENPNWYTFAYLTFTPGKVNVWIGVNGYGMTTGADVDGKDASFVGYSETGDAVYETGEIKNGSGNWVKATVTVSPTGYARVNTYLWARHGFFTSLHLRHGDYDSRFSFAGQLGGVSVAH